MKSGGDEISEVNDPILDISLLNPDSIYNYADYMRWYFKERVELIRGKIRKMSPAPSMKHQAILSNFAAQLLHRFKGESCKVFLAPFDVRLPLPDPKNGQGSTVVQPDVCIVCDRSLLDVQGCNGAPDLIVEILSPANPMHDLSTKYDLYKESGVKEYWIADPGMEMVLVYSLKDNEYRGSRSFGQGMVVKSLLFPSLDIRVSELFKIWPDDPVSSVSNYYVQ